MATKSKAPAAPSSVPAGVARTQANRKRRLTKLLREQPNNEQIKNALLETGTKRKAPNTKQWSKTNIRLAKLFKEFGGRAPKELFSSNPKVQLSAVTYNPNRVLKIPAGKVDFSIGARAFMREGAVWK